MTEAVKQAKIRAGKRATTSKTFTATYGLSWAAPKINIWTRGDVVWRCGYYSGFAGLYQAELQNGEWVWTGWAGVSKCDQIAFVESVKIAAT